MIFNFKTTGGGDAETLGGHGAEYFAPLSLLTAKNMPNGTDLNSCIDIGVYYFDNYATNYVNTPSDTAHNGIMFVRQQSNIRVMQEYISINTGVMYTRTGGINGWTDWKTLATLSDLANYLPKSGGKINGTGYFPLEINGTSSYNENYIRFSSNGTVLGSFGFYGADNPRFVSTSGVASLLLHTGNMADHVLLNTGGNVRGNINLLEDNAAERALRIANSVGTVDMLVTGGGSKGLYDRTTDKWIVRSDNNGEVNFYGKATGNGNPVHIGSSAPSDTTALWIDTSA